MVFGAWMEVEDVRKGRVWHLARLQGDVPGGDEAAFGREECVSKVRRLAFLL